MGRFASSTGLPSSRFDSLTATASGAAADNKSSLGQTAGAFPPDSPLLRPSLDQDLATPMTNGSMASSGLQLASGSLNTDFEAATLAANRKLLAYEGRELNSSFSRALPGSLPGSVGDAGSPKQRKSALERREERAVVSGTVDGKKDFENGFVLRSDAAAATGATSGTNVSFFLTELFSSTVMLTCHL